MKKIILLLTIIIITLNSYSQIYLTAGTNPYELGPRLNIGYIHNHMLYYTYGGYSWIDIYKNDGEWYKGNHIKVGGGVGFNKWSYENVFLFGGINYNNYQTNSPCECVDLNKLWKVSFDLGVTTFLGRNKNIPINLTADFRNMDISLNIGYKFNKNVYRKR